MLGLSSFNVLVHLSPLGNERRILFLPFAKMVFALIGNKKVRLPKGENDVEGFAKVVDSMYKICTQKNLITGKTPTPDDLADIKFPPSLKTALIEKGVKF